MKKAFCLLLALLLAGCAALPEGSVMVPEESGEVYFYGVVKSGGRYYAKVLTEYEDAPDAYLYAPLGDDLQASFQEAGVVGAWNPTDYDSARALARAARAGKITTGARAAYEAAGGCVVVIREVNYYAGNPVTGG